MTGGGRRRVLVTGGAGFLGAHLCERLVDRGDHVICVDDFDTGDPRNVDRLRDRPTFELITHDITRPFDVDADQIYNLACPASPKHYRRDPVRTLKTCVLGALNTLDIAVRAGARIIQASTGEIYGDPLSHPQREDYWGNVNPIGPRACYDEGKRCAETLFFDYARLYGTRIGVVRIFNTYGPRMRLDDGRVVSNFIVQALRGEPVTIFGEGLQTRSFCYVDDLVDGLVRMMDADDTVTGPINLGAPDEFTVRVLAELVIDLAGSRSVLVHAPLPQDDPAQRRPDIGEAERLLDWRPWTELREGLARTIADFDERLSAGAASPGDVADRRRER